MSRLAATLRSFADRIEARGRSKTFGTQAFLAQVGAEYPDTNVDTLIEKKGIGVYRTMWRRDEQVRAAIQFKALARLASGWEILPYEENNDEATEHATFVRYALEQARGSVASLLMDLMDAFTMGFSCVEKVLAAPYEGGPWAGKIGFERFHKIDQEYAELKTDDHGQLLEDGIWQHNPLVASAPDGGTYMKFPRDDFLVYAHAKTGDNWHGESDLRPVYRWYFIKDETIRHWASYLERFGLPLVYGKAKPGMSDTDDDLLTFLQQIRKGAPAVLPDGYEIFFQMPIQGASARENFDKLIDNANRAIARGVLLPSLVMEQGGTGSYALGQEHTDQFVWVLNQIGAVLEEEVMLEQLIKPLIDLNFPQVDGYPKFKFNAYAKDDLKLMVEAMEKLVNMGLEVPKSWARTQANIPEPEEGEEVLAKGPGAGAGGINPLPIPDEMPPGPEDVIGELEKAGLEVTGAVRSGNGNGTVYIATRKRWREPFEEEVVVDFDQVEADATGSIDEGADNVGLIVELARRRAAKGARDRDRPFARRT